jgi:hypothetical protein
MQSDRPRALRRRGPARCQTVDCREVYRLAAAQHRSREKQQSKRHRGCGRRQKCRQRPERHTRRQHALAAQPIGDPAPDHLRPQISPEKRRQDESALRRVVALVMGERDDRDRDIDAVDVAERRRQGEQHHHGVTPRPDVIRRRRDTGRNWNLGHPRALRREPSRYGLKVTAFRISGRARAAAYSGCR